MLPNITNAVWTRLERVAFIKSAILCLPLMVCLFVLGCRSTPVSGRKQVLLVPEQQEIQMGAQAYTEILSKETRSANPRFEELVNRVGQRIAEVVNRPDFQWEFTVVQSKEMNAFALPGGKVCIYEGLLPICEDEAGLAVVMSHEVAHVIARHGSERMSHEMIAQGAGKALDIFTDELTVEEQAIWKKAYGLGSQYGVILPYSRKHEMEADVIGVKLMAEAGYDPSAAVEFWERFAAAKGGEQQPEWLSTHPSDGSRAAALREELPNALTIYSKAQRKSGLGERL
ncbi:TPR repeat-containing protein YfgC precursor [Polystyrenella longa]|uniref:TPR repeat-containing protein YfgC n=1 Tax=Polystyrenella longa TaxID=2528007 RepID=A0A518CIB9_9PLAN|nr:M48 family metallopeptidase [Polystyrenella longa]QDU78972.1 TPR repeat-containing protein YfgC precursor [Polystyrenella longa]